MKKVKRNVRDKMVTLRMTQEELNCLHGFRAKSTEKTNSNYLRKLALQKPIKVLVRNASIDDALLEITWIRKELNHIGVNLNQAVHKLHLLEKIPEFRYWLQVWEQTRKAIVYESEKTTTTIQQLAEKWLQE